MSVAATFAGDPWRQAYEFYVAKGYSPAQAAGIVGGLRGETANLNPTQVHDGGIGLGISGWNGPRLQALKEFAKSRGVAESDLPTQLEFVHHELGTTEKAAGDRIRAAQTPEEAGAATLVYFRPKDYNVPGAHPERARFASQFYTQFTGQPGQPAMPAPAPSAAPAEPESLASAFADFGRPPSLVSTRQKPQFAMPSQNSEDLALDPVFQPRGAQRKRA